MVREVYNRMPDAVQKNLEGLRHDYKHGAYSKDETRTKAAWYVKGLRDAGLITEYERRVLFIYTTV